MNAPTPTPAPSRGHTPASIDEAFALAAELDAADKRVRDAAPELLEALEKVRAIIVEGATVGFDPHSGDWAERLYDSQAMSARAVQHAGGDRFYRTDRAKGEAR